MAALIRSFFPRAVEAGNQHSESECPDWGREPGPGKWVVVVVVCKLEEVGCAGNMRRGMRFGGLALHVPRPQCHWALEWLAICYFALTEKCSKSTSITTPLLGSKTPAEVSKLHQAAC